MSKNTGLPDLATLSAELGQLIRVNELKISGKLLANARGSLHSLAESVKVYQPHYERVASLRNELLEPDDEDLDAHSLLAQLLDQERELRFTMTQHPAAEAEVARAMLRAAAAIVLAFAQDQKSNAPLDF